MKQLLIIGAVAAVLLALALTSGQGQTATTGDTNCDGAVNSIDAALVLQLDARLITSLSCPGNADVNSDSTINAVDAAIILQMSAGLVNGPPVPLPSDNDLYLEALYSSRTDRGSAFKVNVANLSSDWTVCDLTVWVEVYIMRGNVWASNDQVSVAILNPLEDASVFVEGPGGPDTWSAYRAAAEWSWC